MTTELPPEVVMRVKELCRQWECYGVADMAGIVQLAELSFTLGKSLGQREAARKIESQITLSCDRKLIRQDFHTAFKEPR